MPLSLGGFGLYSAAAMAPAAYIAGAVTTLRLSPAFTAVRHGTQALPADSVLLTGIEDSRLRVHDAERLLIERCGDSDAGDKTPRSILPDPAASFVAYLPSMPLDGTIQSSITHRISTLIFNARVAEAGRRRGPRATEEVARIKTLRAAESSRWLQTLPTEHSLRLTDAQWRCAARLRLGIAAPATELDCKGCRKTGAFMDDSWHALSCMKLSGEAVTRRHDSIVMLLARFCRAMLVLTHTEPRQLALDSEQRPDLQIDLADKPLLVDVSFVHPTASSCCRKTAKKGVESVGNNREQCKISKYTALAQRHQAALGAFVLYPYGGFHRSALDVVTTLSDALDPTTALMSRAEWKSMLLDHIAIAIQRGNADIMTAATAKQHRTGIRQRLRRDPLCYDCVCVSADCVRRRLHCHCGDVHSPPSCPTAAQVQAAGEIPLRARVIMPAAAALPHAARGAAAAAAPTTVTTLSAAAAGATSTAPAAHPRPASPTTDSGSASRRLQSELRDLLMEQECATITILVEEEAEAVMDDVSVCAAGDAHAMADDDGRS
jgi:hypothetical protein